MYPHHVLARSSLPRAIVAGLLLAAVLTAHAQQYRWVDEKGRVQYSDRPPPTNAKDMQKKNLDAGAPGSAAEPYALQVARKNAPVKLYSSPDCGPVCDSARALLNQRGIPFAEISISDTTQVEELKRISGGTNVPVMLVGRSVQKGFQENSYHGALDAAGYPATGALPPRKQVAPPPPKPAAEKPAAATADTSAQEPAKAVAK